MTGVDSCEGERKLIRPGERIRSADTEIRQRSLDRHVRQAEEAEQSTVSSGVVSSYESLASESSTLVDCLKASSLCCFGGRSWGGAMRGKIRADLPLPLTVTDNPFGQGRREAYRENNGPSNWQGRVRFWGGHGSDLYRDSTKSYQPCDEAEDSGHQHLPP